MSDALRPHGLQHTRFLCLPLPRDVVQWPSHVWLFVTPRTAAEQASLTFTISWSLLKLISIELMMPSNHLILCHPLLFLSSVFPSIRVFSSELALFIRWPKYWSFSFSISPSNGYSELPFFRIEWSDFLAVQGTLKNLLLAPQFKSISSLALSLSYGPTLTAIHDHWEKPQLWLYRPLLSQWCLCFSIHCLDLS